MSMDCGRLRRLRDAAKTGRLAVAEEEEEGEEAADAEDGEAGPAEAADG